MTDKMYCPRGPGPDTPFHSPFNGEMEWRDDGTCSYCGSLNPDTLMERLEAGDIEVGPTDKSYKIYVRNNGGQPFKQTYREGCDMGKPGSSCTGPDDCAHWTTREVEQTKFYFQHLSKEQMVRFVELLNEKKMKVGYPGHFYVTPYFCKAG